MKTVTVRIGERRHSHTCDVHLNGFEPDMRLTPTLARAALRSVGAQEGIVWDTTLWGGKLLGYRVYMNAVRKLAK